MLGENEQRVTPIQVQDQKRKSSNTYQEEPTTTKNKVGA